MKFIPPTDQLKGFKMVPLEFEKVTYFIIDLLLYMCMYKFSSLFFLSKHISLKDFLIMVLNKKNVQCRIDACTVCKYWVGLLYCTCMYMYMFTSNIHVYICLHFSSF